jgi:Fe-S-cluster-containing dehydrogenase component
MVFEMPSCGGCRTCEMACSFHHTGEFNPSISSIRIIEKEGDSYFFVELVEKAEGAIMACDGCKGFKVPLCMQYCCESDALGEIIGQHMKKSYA